MKNEECDFEVGDKVFTKFRGKWKVGRIEFTNQFGLADKTYMVSFEGAKTFRERTKDELKKYIEFKQTEFDFNCPLDKTK